MNKNLFGLLLLSMTVSFSCTPKKADQQASSAGADLDRTSLPIKEPIRPVYKELDVRNTTAPARFEVKAPKEHPMLWLY